MNAREKLAAVADWLGWAHESLSFGLRNASDGLRLYDYAMAHPELDEFADTWEPEHRITALGYDPLHRAESREAETTGAASAADAILTAHDLIDSVAFVKHPGDSAHALEMLARALNG